MTHFASLVAHCLVCCVLAASSMLHGFHPELVKCLAYSFLAMTAVAEIVEARKSNLNARRQDEYAPQPDRPAEQRTRRRMFRARVGLDPAH